MLKLRIIFGIVFSALFFGLIYLDWYCSRYWPFGHISTAPGTFVALACILVLPLALREMRDLLAKENVQISLRVTIAAALLCTLWPWIEQVGEAEVQKRATVSGWVAYEHSEGASAATQAALLQEIDASPWYAIGQWTLSKKPHYLVPTVLALALVAAVVKYSHKQRVEGAMANAGATLLAIVYLGVLPGFFLPICMTHSAWMLLAIVAIVKAADVGAYTTGKLIGKHKLIPWLSPGKTVEGFVGGLALSGIVGAILAYQFPPFAWQQGLIGGILLGAVGQVGDLLESLLKRDAGVKDSGHVPGFGGILDLLDSPLLAAPVAYWLLKLVAHN